MGSLRYSTQRLRTYRRILTWKLKHPEFSTEECCSRYNIPIREFYRWIHQHSIDESEVHHLWREAKERRSAYLAEQYRERQRAYKRKRRQQRKKRQSKPEKGIVTSYPPRRIEPMSSKERDAKLKQAIDLVQNQKVSLAEASRRVGERSCWLAQSVAASRHGKGGAWIWQTIDGQRKEARHDGQ